MENTNDLGKYLGVPTINGRITKSQYQYVMERLINAWLDGRLLAYPWQEE